MQRYDLEVVRGEEGLDVVAGVEVPAVLLLRDHARGGPPLPGRGGAVPAGRLPVGTVRRPAPGHRRRRRVDGLLLAAVRLAAAAPLLQRETHADRRYVRYVLVERTQTPSRGEETVNIMRILQDRIGGDGALLAY